jgi:hypothetical protein
MALCMFVLMLVQAAAPGPASTLDYGYFKSKVQPMLLEKRPGHARCSTCHSRSTAFRLQPLPAGRTAYTEEESRKNFEAASRMVLPGVPLKSRLLTMPLAHEAGGTEFHPGGKHWTSQDDPQWKALADWVKNASRDTPPPPSYQRRQ